MVEDKKYTLIIDNREEQNSKKKERLEALEKRERFDIHFQMLEVGDILIKEKNYIIEVKTITDFYNSITNNNHIFNQAINMKANYENCAIIIIGYFDEFSKGQKSTYFAENYMKVIHVCMGAYISLVEKYKIKIYWVASPYLFSKTVEYIADKAGETPEVKDLVKLDYTTQQRYISSLTAVNRLGLDKAKKIAEMYPCYRALLGASKEDLEKIPGVGEVLSSNILAFINGE